MRTPGSTDRHVYSALMPPPPPSPTSIHKWRSPSSRVEQVRTPGQTNRQMQPLCPPPRQPGPNTKSSAAHINRMEEEEAQIFLAHSPRGLIPAPLLSPPSLRFKARLPKRVGPRRRQALHSHCDSSSFWGPRDGSPYVASVIPPLTPSVDGQGAGADVSGAVGPKARLFRRVTTTRTMTSTKRTPRNPTPRKRSSAGPTRDSRACPAAARLP